MRVTLLTQEQCDFCRDAEALLDRLAHEYPLTVELLDLGSPEGRRLAEAGGILFPPGVFIDGEPFSYGRPSERRLRRELERRLDRQAAGA
jgi:glutaredoxin